MTPDEKFERPNTEKIYSPLTRTTAALGLAGALTLVVGIQEQAHALEMKSISLYSQHQALSTNQMYQWSAAYKVERPGLSDVWVSGVAVAPNLILASAHGVPGPSALSQVTEVVFGANYNTSPFRLEVASWERFPGYISGNTSTIDLSFIWLKDPIPGFTNHVNFTNANIGDLLTMVSYGNYGDVNTGELASLGDRLAGVAPVESKPGAGYPSSNYAFMDFDGSSSLFALPAEGLNGDSGSPWFSPNGDLVALSTAAINGLGGGYTIGLRLNLSEVQAELAPRIAYSWAQYYLSSLSLTTSGTNLILSWMGDVKLQSATNVAGPFVTLPGATSPYTNSMSAPQEFFRLASTNAP